MKRSVYFLAVVFTALILASCEDDLTGNNGGSSGGGNYSYGDAYFRVVNESYSGISSYSDNNPCIPSSFYLSSYYGPCNTGTYTYNATLNSGTYWSGNTYSMYRPTYGYNRYYTLSFTETASYLNYYDVGQ